jgi:hypothetical protein
MTSWIASCISLQFSRPRELRWLWIIEAFQPSPLFDVPITIRHICAKRQVGNALVMNSGSSQYQPHCSDLLRWVIGVLWNDAYFASLSILTDSFWVTNLYAEHRILPIRQIWPLRLLAFLASEKSVSGEFMQRTWWTFLRSTGNSDGSRSRDFGCGISSMEDPIAKINWCKCRMCWVMLQLKCLIPFSKR